MPLINFRKDYFYLISENHNFLKFQLTALLKVFDDNEKTSKTMGKSKFTRNCLKS